MASGLQSCFFRSFTPNDLLYKKDWDKLEPIMTGNGGAFGIAGPRGSGKTWLILRAKELARDKGGIGLWFPAPSDYGAEPFLRALGTSFAAEVQQRYIEGKPSWYDYFGSIWILMIGYLLLIWAAVECHLKFEIKNFNTLLIIFQEFISFPKNLYQILFLLGLFLLIVNSKGLTSKGSKAKRLYHAASLMEERIRYSESLTHKTEASAKGSGVVSGLLKFGLEKSLVERPLTLAGIVHDFRKLLEQTAIFTKPVVIGIDELDKIHDPEDAKRLLRDIKGIFEIEGVHFLVSVSDQARLSLQLGSLRIKDEFSSSFYTVIETEPLSPDESAIFLESRCPGVLSREAALAMGILSGGNLRELLRLADVSRRDYMGEALTAQVVVRTLWNFELSAFQYDLLRSKLDSDVKVSGYSRLAHMKGKLEGCNEKWFHEFWDPSGAQPAFKYSIEWQDEYGEAWRRFLIRSAVSAHLASDNAIESINDILMRVVRISEYSADIARVLLEKFWQSEAGLQESKELVENYP